MANQYIFQRVEKKYQLTPEQYNAFLHAIQTRIQQDEYGLHTIHNIYYDTPYYDLIRDSIEKPKYKEKFRVRGYGRITDDSPVFLEIKKKIQRRRVQTAHVSSHVPGQTFSGDRAFAGKQRSDYAGNCLLYAVPSSGT